MCFPNYFYIKFIQSRELVISWFASRNCRSELMRYTLPAADATQGREECCDNIYIVKKTGILHNAKNIATSAIRPYVDTRTSCARTPCNPKRENYNAQSVPVPEQR